MFTREEIIVRSKFVCNLSLTLRIDEVLKNLASLQRNVPSLWVQFLQKVSYNKYWHKVLKNTSHQDKSCESYRCWKMVCQLSSKLILCWIDTSFSFWFLKKIIGVWTIGLFQKNFSTTKLRDWKQRFKVKTCPNNIILVLHISISISRYVGRTYQHFSKQKKYIASIILRIFLEILVYWKEKLFNITINTIPI